MMTLDEIRPSPAEQELTKDMPEQVAIGYIRAKRRAEQRPGNFSFNPLDIFK